MRPVLILLSLLALPVQADPTIWKCEDLKKITEFSSIKCGPDAQIYVPSKPNTGGVGGRSYSREYIEFLNRHRLIPEQVTGSRARPSAPARNESGNRKEARDIRGLGTYAVPVR